MKIHLHLHTWTSDTHLTLHHVPVGIVGDGVDVGGDFVSFLSLVHVDDLLRVDG